MLSVIQIIASNYKLWHLHTFLTVFGLTRLWLKHMIYQTRGEHVTHYSTMPLSNYYKPLLPVKLLSCLQIDVLFLMIFSRDLLLKITSAVFLHPTKQKFVKFSKVDNWSKQNSSVLVYYFVLRH